MQPENEEKTVSPGNGESVDGQMKSMDPSLLNPDSPIPYLEKKIATIPVVAIPLSDEEMREVAQELNLMRWKPERMKSLGKLGDYLREQGAIRVSLGEYVFSNEMRRDLLDECRERLRVTKDPEMYAALLDQMNALLGAKDAAVKQIIDAMKVGLIREPEPDSGPKLPPRGSPIILIQNNNKMETLAEST